MSTMRQALGHLSRLLVVPLILLAGSTVVVGAQESTTITLTLEASPPWTEDVSQEVVPASTPGQLLSDGERYVLVLGGAFDDAAQVRLDALVELGAAGDSVETVDAGETASLSYWLDAAQVDGQPWGAFTIVRTAPDSGAQEFTMYVAPVDGFAEGLASAQGAISVNGEPVFDGVGGVRLQELLLAAVPATASPEADPEVPDKGVYEDRQEAPVETWTDPVHGFDVTWQGDWEFDTRGENTLMLASDGGTVFLDLTGMPGEGATTEGMLTRMVGGMSQLEEDLGVTFEPAGFHVDGDNAILAGFVDGMPFIQECVFIQGGQTVVVITVGVDPDEDIEESIALYRDSVRIAGVPPLDRWDTIDMEAAA